MSNTIGKMFRVTNFGESHGKAVGVVIDGCPSLLPLTQEDIQKELDRRKPGQSSITTPRKEYDKIEILSGVYKAKTTGAPIAMIIKNKDVMSKDYKAIEKIFRPGHADFSYHEKYGIRDPAGGGRSSARVTAGNVAAGAIAKKILKKAGIYIVAYVKQVKNVKADIKIEKISQDLVEASTVRCPDIKSSKKMIDLIDKTKKSGDSVGGIIECIIRGVPAGLGEPIFSKLSADLSHSIMSINACKGFELGSGFDCVKFLGNRHNDEFMIKDDKVVTETNNCGGVLGGISTGMPIIFRAAFKPTPTITKKQKTVTSDKVEAEIEAKGRHDPCVLPRAVPVVEAMAAITLVDHYLMKKAMER